jgi:hypothetical protein
MRFPRDDDRLTHRKPMVLEIGIPSRHADLAHSSGDAGPSGTGPGGAGGRASGAGQSADALQRRNYEGAIDAAAVARASRRGRMLPPW